jgi:hypothetical protein
MESGELKPLSKTWNSLISTRELQQEPGRLLFVLIQKHRITFLHIYSRTLNSIMSCQVLWLILRVQIQDGLT